MDADPITVKVPSDSIPLAFLPYLGQYTSGPQVVMDQF